VNRGLEQLTAAQHKAAEAMYRQQTPGGDAGAGSASGASGSGEAGTGGGSAPKGDVIDAEVVDEGKQ